MADLNERRVGDNEAMETFAAKVRHGSGPRCDPMLEEKGGWISGDAPVPDMEMMEAVIESMAQGNKQNEEGALNPFRAQPGEILPKDCERNYSGFLVRKNAISFKVDGGKLVECVVLLKEQILIAKFMGTKPNHKALEIWLKTLNYRLRYGSLTLSRNAGKGFSFLLVVRRM